MPEQARPVCLPRSGTEWLIDAAGCEPGALRDRARLSLLVDRMLSELSLRPVAPPLWHVFPGEGGVTALVLLEESHLTLHTFPEHGTLSLNVYSCTGRPRWAFEQRLEEHLGAARVRVRELVRGEEEP